MKIGIIGNGNHSKRIQNILKKKKINFIIYKPKKPKYFDKLNYLKLLECNAIFIVSPNDSHFKYIKEFSKKGIYIFCEKPPCSSFEEVHNLSLLNRKNKERIYFNFN